MELSTFNKKLKKLVNKARKEEAHKNFEDAKEAWIEVAEFTIHFYKHTKLEPSFRNMLIRKTEGIIQHVKNLDKEMRMSETISDLSQEQGAEPEAAAKEQPPEDTQPDQIPEGSAGDDQPITPPDSVPQQSDQTAAQQGSSDGEIPMDGNSTELPSVPSKPPQNEPEVIQDSEYKNIPDGIKEIKAPKDFEVITPYDKEEIEKRLSINGDMSIFKQDNEEDSSNNDVSMQTDVQKENKSKNEEIICFACGEKNPPGTKICSNCGTELE